MNFASHTNDSNGKNTRKRTKANQMLLNPKGFIVALLFLVILALIPVGGDKTEYDKPLNNDEVDAMNLSSFPTNSPGAKLHLLFIHHSIGGQLMADKGRDNGENCIYETSPNGGGLRSLLQKEGYIVHEASYGSEVGGRTDIFDWPPKFKNDMDKVLRCDHQDTYFKGSTKNHIVIFKSCYPNNNFSDVGKEPGNPSGSKLTVANAKAAYIALLSEFAEHTEVLFVAMTAPPIVGKLSPEPLWKFLARKILRRPLPKPSTAGQLAREFNNWLKAETGWLATYKHKNIVVFDYYDILTAHGKSNYAEFPSAGGNNSHPNNVGNTQAARAFVPFLNQAVHRAGLIERAS